MLLRGEWAELRQIWPGHFSTIGQCAADFEQYSLRARFSERGKFVSPISQSWEPMGSELSNFGRRKSIIGAPGAPFRFEICWFISNRSALNWIGIENWGQIS